jgi:hypothetical protein
MGGLFIGVGVSCDWPKQPVSNKMRTKKTSLLFMLGFDK